VRIATVDGVRTLLVTHRPSGLAVVVDASIVVKWLAREQDSEAATRVMVDDRPLTAPDLLPVEVANVFWKKVRRGDMPTTELRPAITNLLAVDIELHHSTALLNRATTWPSRPAIPSMIASTSPSRLIWARLSQPPIDGFGRPRTIWEWSFGESGLRALASMPLRGWS